MIEHQVDSIKGIKLKEALKKIADTDYRVIKAVEAVVAETLEEMYPGEITRREALREEIRGLTDEAEGSTEDELE